MHINCQFSMSRASAVYYTGEQVSGSFALSRRKKPLQLEAVSISLLGRSSISWQEPDRSLPPVEHNDSTITTTETGHIDFVAQQTHVQQTQQLLQQLKLPAGATQRCSFEFELPEALPGSCRLPLGATSYVLQLTLQRRGKHDKHFQQRLCVRRRIELPQLLPASSDNGALRLELPRSVCAPGQRVAYRVHATQLPATCCTRLCQAITYRSQHPSVKSKRVLRVLDESFQLAAALHLPLTAPIMSQLMGGPIEIEYFLETLSGGAEQPLRLPLLVGTVAPPGDVVEATSLGFDNFALCENDVLCSSINQLVSHSCSREWNAPTTTLARHGEQLKLLRRQKKRSYVRLALQYFYKTLRPVN